MKVLTYRFSSFGDVALTVPVFHSLLESNPDLEITFVSRPVFKPLFDHLPRLSFVGVNLDEYQGPIGLFRLQQKLATYKWDYIVDLHSVLRTWILNSFFRLAGYSVSVLDKGRKEKDRLTRKKNKILTRLPHTTERYLAAFAPTGLEASLSNANIPNPAGPAADISEFLQSNELVKQGPWVAIAPFSKHKQKEWSLEHIETLISELPYTIFLFGAGQKEAALLARTAERHNHVINIADVLSMEQEISLLQSIDVMVSMDSFNMHLASLAGIPVVSIWGATHHFAGFGPGASNEALIVERTDLECRPCSVFGNKSCFRGDLACLDIDVHVVKNKIEQVLK